MTTTIDNATTGGGGGHLFGGSHGGFSYAVAISAGILLHITTITLASYFCTRDGGDGSHSYSHSHHRHSRRHSHRHHEYMIEGIDEATLETYPKYVYSQLEKKKKGSSASTSTSTSTSTSSSCSICLGEYKGKDVIRVLIECGHVFHQKCVDPWLRIHPTCPLCRTSPLPTPQSTPLAQVAPLVATAI